MKALFALPLNALEESALGELHSAQRRRRAQTRPWPTVCTALALVWYLSKAALDRRNRTAGVALVLFCYTRSRVADAERFIKTLGLAGPELADIQRVYSGLVPSCAHALAEAAPRRRADDMLGGPLQQHRAEMEAAFEEIDKPSTQALKPLKDLPETEAASRAALAAVGSVVDVEMKAEAPVTDRTPIAKPPAAAPAVVATPPAVRAGATRSVVQLLFACRRTRGAARTGAKGSCAPAGGELQRVQAALGVLAVARASPRCRLGARAAHAADRRHQGPPLGGGRCRVDRRHAAPGATRQ